MEEIDFLLNMSEDERRIAFGIGWVREAENQLQWMVEYNIRADEQVQQFIDKAKSLVRDYQMFGEEHLIDSAEVCTEIAKGLKANKFTIRDIRKQREIVWREKRLLASLRRSSTVSEEPSRSSKTSAH